MSKHENTEGEFCPKLRKQLDEAIVKCIVQDSRSFNDFNKPGMLELLRIVAPGYVPRGRRTNAKYIRLR